MVVVEATSHRPSGLTDWYQTRRWNRESSRTNRMNSQKTEHVATLPARMRFNPQNSVCQEAFPAFIDPP
jgi:hypothetical protein